MAQIRKSIVDEHSELEQAPLSQQSYSSQEHIQSIDDVLDDIEAVLELDAQTYVNSFVQQVGQ